MALIEVEEDRHDSHEQLDIPELHSVHSSLPRMKFNQHNSSPFSGLFSRRSVFRGHLSRSGAFIRSSAVRFLSQDSRNAYENSTSGGRAPLYSKLLFACANALLNLHPSRTTRRSLAKYPHQMVPSPSSRWRASPHRYPIPKKVDCP